MEYRVLIKDIHELRFRLDKSRHGAKNIKFEELYNNVEDCLLDLKELDNTTVINKCKGYKYIISFKSQLEQEKKLSDKQLIQVKRLSGEIARGKYYK